MHKNVIWEGDTARNHYRVIDTLYDNRPARVLYSGDEQAAQSGVATDDKADLLFDYNQRFFELATNLVPKCVLIIGGGVGTLATALLAALPETAVDIVEPDKDLIDLGYEFFDLPKSERLSIYTTDGRSYLACTKQRYEMIFVDAFNHTTIPEDLRTIEAFEAYYAHITDRGICAMNVISGYNGTSGTIVKQLTAAVQTTFRTVDIFLASRGFSLWLPQNFVLAAQKGTDLSLQDYVRHEAVSLPDTHEVHVLHDR